MAVPIVMPRLGDFMMEGTVAKWSKSDGDSVGQGEVIAEIETEKINYDLEATDSGVLHQAVAEGAVVPVDVQVAVAMHLKVEQPVERKLVKHVVEKANACVHIRLSGAVEIDKHPDFCLLGFALNRGGSCLIHTPSHLLVSVSLLPHLTAEA